MAHMEAYIRSGQNAQQPAGESMGNAVMSQTASSMATQAA